MAINTQRRVVIVTAGEGLIVQPRADGSGLEIQHLYMTGEVAESFTVSWKTAADLASVIQAFTDERGT